MKVLVFEDCADLSELIGEVILGAGYRPVLCDSTDWESVDAMLGRVCVEDPDVILLDAGLGAIDGFALVDRIRQQGIDTPLILSTGVPSRMAERAGPNVVLLPKPYAPEELVEALREVERWLDVVESGVRDLAAERAGKRDSASG